MPGSSLQGKTLMMSLNKLSVGQLLIFLMLTFTTVLGGLIYLGYLGIVHRMDRTDPIIGPQVRAREAAREAAIQKDRQERHDSFFRTIKSPFLWGPIAAFLTVRFLIVHL
jgi:hypothetical protein